PVVSVPAVGSTPVASAVVSVPAVLAVGAGLAMTASSSTTMSFFRSPYLLVMTSAMLSLLKDNQGAEAPVLSVGYTVSAALKRTMCSSSTRTAPNICSRYTTQLKDLVGSSATRTHGSAFTCRPSARRVKNRQSSWSVFGA